MPDHPTPPHDPTPSPLELATAARVSCAALEQQLARGQHKKALDTARRLWQRIEAMAGRIEDLTAQLEGHYIGGEVSVLIVDTPEEAERLSEERLRPSSTCAATDEDLPPPRLLNGRPPGFLEVRRRMQRHGRRTDAIDRIKSAGRASDDPAPHQPRARTTEWKGPHKKARPWKRLVTAIEEARLPLNQSIPVGDIKREIGLCSATFGNLQADLVLEGQPYRIERKGPRNATIVRI